MQKKLLVLSDLDGTFLDHDNYSFEKSLDALKLLISKSGSIAFVTSKTAAEVLSLIEELRVSGIPAPIAFAVENGCGIYLPIGSYSHEEINRIIPDLNVTEKDGYYVISFGSQKYQDLRVVLKEIEQQIGKKNIGFGDMTALELAENSGLSVEQSQLAKNREFDEPYYIIEGDDKDYQQAKEITESKGLSYHKGGRYAHISLPQDKGKAAEILLKLHSKNNPIVSVGIGDAENDLAFLDACERGYLVRGKKEITKDLPDNIQRIAPVGSLGFSEVIRKELC
jgi:mannosyl-3-phosphoglycerate phosphatase